MADKFNPNEAAKYFTRGFLKKHVFLGNEDQKKKHAEKVFSKRRGQKIKISTVLCLTPKEFKQLAGEIHNRQEEYKKKPGGTFTSLKEYDNWTRFCSSGDKKKDKKRAKEGRCKFSYKVSEADGRFAVAHLEPIRVNLEAPAGA